MHYSPSISLPHIGFQIKTSDLEGQEEQSCCASKSHCPQERRVCKAEGRVRVKSTFVLHLQIWWKDIYSLKGKSMFNQIFLTKSVQQHWKKVHVSMTFAPINGRSGPPLAQVNPGIVPQVWGYYGPGWQVCFRRTAASRKSNHLSSGCTILISTFY